MGHGYIKKHSVVFLKTLWIPLKEKPYIMGRDDIQSGENQFDWERDMIHRNPQIYEEKRPLVSVTLEDRTKTRRWHHLFNQYRRGMVVRVAVQQQGSSRRMQVTLWEELNVDERSLFWVRVDQFQRRVQNWEFSSTDGVRTDRPSLY